MTIRKGAHPKQYTQCQDQVNMQVKEECWGEEERSRDEIIKWWPLLHNETREPLSRSETAISCQNRDCSFLNIKSVFCNTLPLTNLICWAWQKCLISSHLKNSFSQRRENLTEWKGKTCKHASFDYYGYELAYWHTKEYVLLTIVLILIWSWFLLL